MYVSFSVVWFDEQCIFVMEDYILLGEITITQSDLAFVTMLAATISERKKTIPLRNLVNLGWFRG